MGPGAVPVLESVSFTADTVVVSRYPECIDRRQGTAHMVSDCVFCTRHDQPPILFETHSYYVMPDKFPTAPGHTLIITKEHRRCHASAPAAVLEELDQAAADVRRFLSEAYELPVLTIESGVAHQTVFHAHLHLIPAALKSVPEELSRSSDAF